MMKILVVGAGAVGGYFGGRLAEKGEDVTFLVRERRAKELERTGLEIDSPHGDVSLTPRLIQVGTKETFDLVIVSTKAYHLEHVIGDLEGFVGPDTYVLPVLNGMRHIEQLVAKFGETRVLGGLCFIESTLDTNGRVIQTSPAHQLVFGPRTGDWTDRLFEVKEALAGTKASIKASDHIMQDMWQKYLFITTFSGVTSLFRAPIGPIRDDDAGDRVIRNVLQEAKQAMESQGATFVQHIEQEQEKRIHQMAPDMKSSLQRDMEKQGMVEADHLFGSLIEGTEPAVYPTLRMIHTNLKIYERLRSGVSE